MSNGWIITDHVRRVIKEKGFSPDDVAHVILYPERVNKVRNKPPQVRHMGRGLAVVLDPEAKKVITCYLDEVVTPLRPDQLSNPIALNSKRLKKLAKDT